MPELHAYLRSFDDTWAHAWESFQAVLAGVTEGEALHQDAAYEGEAREEGWPPPGTIAWQVAHVAHCKRHYTDLLLQLGRDTRPEARPWVTPPSFAALMEVLAEAHAEQRAAIAALSEDQLPLQAGNEMPLEEFLRMCIRHDTWHAAQIAVARRLARASG